MHSAFVPTGSLQYVNRKLVVEKPWWLKEQEVLVYSELCFVLFDQQNAI